MRDNPENGDAMPDLSKEITEEDYLTTPNKTEN